MGNLTSLHKPETPAGLAGPSLDEIRALAERLAPRLVRTPLVRCAALEEHLGLDAQLFGKLEFLQQTGTFKARGALAVVDSLDEATKARGVTAVSAGNHAIATAYAARQSGISARLVMTRSANAARIRACREYGADIEFAEDVHEAFELARSIQEKDGRYLVHPFEGPLTAMGTGTLGVEMLEQCPEADVVIAPIGGGGLMGGVANAVKQLRPECEVIGVEPFGADTMHRSVAAGEPQAIDTVQTIADSLGAPYALPYSFELCRQNVDTLCRVSDDDLRVSMRMLFEQMHIAVEPACAASTAAANGPLRDVLKGRTVVLLFCGSNIDWATFAGHAGFNDHGD